MVMELVIAYKPQIESLIKSFKSFIDWIKDNKDTIIALGSGIVKITVATYAFGRAVAAVKTVIGAYKSLEAVLIAVGVAQKVVAEQSVAAPVAKAVVQGAGYARNAIGFGAVQAAETVAVKSEAAAVGAASGAGGVATFVIAFLPEILAAATVVAAVGVLYSKLHVTDERKEEFDKEQAESNMILMQIAKNTEPKPANVMGMNFTGTGKISSAISSSVMAQDAILAGAKKNTPKDKTKSDLNKALSDAQNNVTGQQIKNYNITIRELVHEFNVRTETLKDSKNDIKMLVAAALTDAVNDAQISH